MATNVNSCKKFY